MTVSTEAKVTSSGQISVPAPLRRRWHTDVVLVIDRGDYAVVRPVPADPITALRSTHASDGLSTDDVRAAERAADVSRPRRGQGVVTVLDGYAVLASCATNQPPTR
jgi:bifunctional DNA-binding transcriptional regulator/antitoxin component of YhaV-PrlF toxin-antitoxin module